MGLFLFIAAIAALVFFYFRSVSAPVSSVAYSDFIDMVHDERRKPQEVTIYDGEIIQWLGAGRTLYKTNIPYQDPA